MPGQTVLLVDDHPVFRSGMRTLIEREDWVASVVEAGNVQEAVGLARTTTIDVAVMDLRLPDGDGVLATRRILDSQANTRILVLTMSEDERSISEALAAGARGYVMKSSDPDVIVAAIHTVARGGYALGPRINASALLSGPQTPKAPPPLDRLTPRELEVLTSLASGESNSVIAAKQKVTEKTVRTLLSNICAKLEVADRVEAALLARDRGIGRPLQR